MSTSQEIANRALKYEHARQLKRLNDELSNTFKITVKELRCKLQLEKCRDLTKQKDDINRKHGVEIKKLAKSHEVREQKLSSELTRLREERGSTSARGQRSTDILDGQLRVTRASADRSQKKCRQLEARLVEYKSTEVQRSRECNLQRHASDKKIKELRRNGELEIRKLVS